MGKVQFHCIKEENNDLEGSSWCTITKNGNVLALQCLSPPNLQVVVMIGGSY
jgi:hypothetical protein